MFKKNKYSCKFHMARPHLSSLCDISFLGCQSFKYLWIYVGYFTNQSNTPKATESLRDNKPHI